MLIRSVEKIKDRNYLQMEYDKLFIDRMKASIPFPLRQWDADKKQWHFSDKGLEMLRNLPNVKFYEDALKEVVDTSQYNLPVPYGKIDPSIDFEKFRRAPTDNLPELYPYDFQKRGISRLVNMEAQGLYFECGLGKTYTSICAAKELLDRKMVSKVLIISMVSIAISSWTNTLDRMGYSYQIIDGPLKYRPSLLKHSKVDFIITLSTSCDDDKYPLVDEENLNLKKKKGNSRKKRSFVDIALETRKLMLIVDELHKMSNTQSGRFKCLLKIRKGCVRGVGLTGTVMKSTPEKCLLPLRFEYPDVFSRKSEFENAFTIKEQGRFGMNIVGYRNLDILKNILFRAGMPALKKDYLKDLPPLLPPKLIYCETDDISIKLVDKIRNEEACKLGKGDEYTELKDVYIRTHEALVCPSMFDPKLRATNRLEAVADCLDNLDGKTVIFTTLKSAILELYSYLTEKGYGCTCCSGSQSAEEIDRRVKKFVTDDSCTVLIATIQKMGTGFDGIKIAQNAIIYDFNTNSADLIQAIGRLHRDGQKKTVSQIYILQDNAISEYQYRKVMKQKEMTESVEDFFRGPINSTIDMREVLDLIKDSKNFLRRKH